MSKATLIDVLHLPDGRGLGRIPDDSRRKFALPKFTDVLPESELVEFEDQTPLAIKDQNGFGACNGHAAATALEYARWVASPTAAYQPLSAWFVYAILCNGVDRGSMILDALELTTQTGTCPDDLVPHGTINPRRLSAEARAAAGRFKIEIGRRLQSWREIISAVRLRCSLNFSLLAWSGFDNLDGEGVPQARRGAGNHAVMIGGGLKKSSRHGWVVKMRNSWTTRWGRDGCCWISEAFMANQPYFECYEIVATTEDPADKDNPPEVKP